MAGAPPAIKVIEDVYGRVVPLASDPLVDEEKRPYIVAMPKNIPDSWLPRPDSSEEYAKAMERYQQTTVDRHMSRIQKRTGELDDDFVKRQEKEREIARRGFGKVKKGRVCRSSVNPY